MYTTPFSTTEPRQTPYHCDACLDSGEICKLCEAAAGECNCDCELEACPSCDGESLAVSYEEDRAERAA